MLPLVLDPAFAHHAFTIVRANGSPMIDPRTGWPFEFRTRKAAMQQAYAMKIPSFRVAGLS